MEYYSAITRNKSESVVVKWMNLEPLIQSEMSEKEKQVLYINAYIWNLKKNGNNEPSRQQTCGHRGR